MTLMTDSTAMQGIIMTGRLRANCQHPDSRDVVSDNELYNRNVCEFVCFCSPSLLKTRGYCTLREYMVRSEEVKPKFEDSKLIWICSAGEAWKTVKKTRRVRVGGLAHQSKSYMDLTPSGDVFWRPVGYMCVRVGVNVNSVCLEYIKCEFVQEANRRHMACELYLRIDGAEVGGGCEQWWLNYKL